MKKLRTFIKATIAGGILFLIPVIALTIILAKAIGILRRLSAAIAEKIPYTQIAGIGVITLISIMLLLIVCFLAGIFMKTSLAHKLTRWIEDKVLIYVPGYSYLQAISNDKLSTEGANWKPATIFVDDNEVLCFVTDETGDYCSIFLPSTPNPSTGSICAREKTKVTYLTITVSEAVLIIRQFGKGAASVTGKTRSAEPNSYHAN